MGKHTLKKKVATVKDKHKDSYRSPNTRPNPKDIKRKLLKPRNGNMHHFNIAGVGHPFIKLHLLEQVVRRWDVKTGVHCDLEECVPLMCPDVPCRALPCH